MQRTNDERLGVLDERLGSAEDGLAVHREGLGEALAGGRGHGAGLEVDGQALHVALGGLLVGRLGHERARAREHDHRVEVRHDARHRTHRLDARLGTCISTSIGTSVA